MYQVQQHLGLIFLPSWVLSSRKFFIIFLISPYTFLKRDYVTLGVIEKGKRNVEILKQAQNDPFTVEDQVAIIYLGSKNLLKSVPVDKIKEFEKKFLDLMNLKHRKTLDTIKKGKLTDDVLSTLESVAADLASSYE